MAGRFLSVELILDFQPPELRNNFLLLKVPSQQCFVIAAWWMIPRLTRLPAGISYTRLSFLCDFTFTYSFSPFGLLYKEYYRVSGL